jgi:chromosome segregation ATPase
MRQELFSKLRFSYHEQVTKEKFIRAITSSPPLFIDSSDNAALEELLLSEKTTLKAQKEEVAKLTSELEAQARALAQRYEALEQQKAALELLPEQIADLEQALGELRKEYPQPDPNVPKHLTLGLDETRDLLAKQQRENEDLDEQIALLQGEIPRADRELTRLEDELSQLGAAKKVAVHRAREARERKENGGMDEVERRGRWCRAGEAVMMDIVG